MASNLRAEKAGFAKEAQEKINEKFDGAEAAKVINWITCFSPPSKMPNTFVETVNNLPKTATSICMSEFIDYLSDGMVLGYLMGCLDEQELNLLQTLKAWQKSNMPAFETSRQRERISLFLKFAGSYGVDGIFQFQTDQLYESTNPPQVVICLRQLGIEAQCKPNFSGPRDYWPSKHKENKREFTEEQLRSGSTIIGLQMGTNAGANASGVSFGGQRHITDSF